MEKTKGFVLTSIKYGDTSAILQVYTQDFALISLMLRGVYGGKNKRFKSINYPFTEIEFSFKPQQKSSLIIPSNLQVSNSFFEMHQHPIKAIMLQFIAEVVHQCLKQDEKNLDLYEFLEEQIQIFNNKKEHFAEFHLNLFLNLTSYFGFFPNQENFDFPYFDLIEGRFTQQNKSPYLLSAQETEDWKNLMQSEFTEESKNQFNTVSRQRLTEILLDYLRIHLEGFKEPKSLLILKEVLSA